MGQIITDSSNYTNIADMIRAQNGGSDTYYPSSMASAIRRIPMPYKESFSNGFRGIEVARVASSYRLANELGQDTIVYAHGSLPFSDLSLSDVITAGGLEVRDSSGQGKCDCSIFVGLVLRGVDWENSFYPDHTGANAKWNPSTELTAMFTRDWGDKALDHQLESAFNNIGLAGYSSVRLVLDYARYLKRSSYVLYDAENDGGITDEIVSLVEPGDIVMQKASDSSDTTIVHMFVIAERPLRLWECTEGLTPQLSYSSVSSRTSNIRMIIRPDYRIAAAPGLFPVGSELLAWPWLSSGAVASYTESGITFTATSSQSIHLSGTSTAAINFAIRGLTNVEYVTLPAGTYKVTGMSGTGIASVNCAIQVRKSDGTDLSPSVRCYDGTDATFTLATTTNLIVRLYISSGYTLNSTITPSITRLS